MVVMQKVRDAMPALIEEAFRDAQAESLAAYHRARVGGFTRQALDRIEAEALITAYLSHDAVLEKASRAFGLGSGAQAYRDTAAYVLQAIGARKP
jgi:hypothetical protein